MTRLVIAAALAAAAAATAPPAQAAPMCGSTLCARATMTGDSAGCTFVTTTTRRCAYRFVWSASGDSVLPGTVRWRMSSPAEVEDDAATWTSGGYDTGDRTTALASEVLPCGALRTVYATLHVEADNTLTTASAAATASFTIVAPC